MDKMDELYEIAKSEGITIDEVLLPDLGAVVLKMEDGCYIGLDKNASSDPQQKKELLAHELGHCVRNAVYSIDSSYPHGKLEHQASAWAIKKLIPKDQLIKALKNRGIDITDYDIAEHFGVSVEFLYKAVEYYKNSAPMR